MLSNSKTSGFITAKKYEFYFFFIKTLFLSSLWLLFEYHTQTKSEWSPYVRFWIDTKKRLKWHFFPCEINKGWIYISTKQFCIITFIVYIHTNMNVALGYNSHIECAIKTHRYVILVYQSYYNWQRTQMNYVFRFTLNNIILKIILSILHFLISVLSVLNLICEHSVMFSTSVLWVCEIW